MSDNRSRGWKMFFGSVFVLFFWGGGLANMPYAGWDSLWGKIEMTAFVIACITLLAGLYKGVTGR
ncbi:MAG TPA: hypothetical protein VKU19_04295 [Bryobacteraceae bacterium]|nr:hypothetical protein [Bryobacteraceae bacterium]